MLHHELCQILPGSPAQRAGILPGDLLTHIDGHPIRDVIDYQYFVVAGNPVLTVVRGGQTMKIRVRKREGEPLGVYFDTMLMDKTRTCANRCVFCFIDQMPPRLRETLYVKDDDWRMSMLTGNYVTLTNVSDAELDRIVARQASPLYISVHAADPQVRAAMMQNPNAARLMPKLDKLRAGGIRFNAQIVVCPGLNDGRVLEETIQKLLDYDNCLSIAMVPVGLTAYRESLYPVTPMNRERARAVLAIYEKYRDSGRVFASDEFYIRAQMELPPCESYGDFPQIDNGVGMLRLFEDDYLYARTQLKQVRPRRVLIATGVSAAGFIRDMLEKAPVVGVQATVLAVENHFFGPTITVAGLLTGSDLIRALKDIQIDEILISASMLRADEEIFLDDMTLKQVQAQLKSPLHVSPADGAGFARALAGVQE